MDFISTCKIIVQFTIHVNFYLYNIYTFLAPGTQEAMKLTTDREDLPHDYHHTGPDFIERCDRY
jgi:hypothetical protein